MPLQGTFDVLDFAEIIRLLGRRGVTGRLHLRSRSITANLFFDEGKLVGADQSEHQAAAATGDVRSRLEEVCFELLEADRGTFEFQPGKPTGLPGAPHLAVDTVLARARKRLEEWRSLVERVPSLDVHPRIVTNIDASEVTLDKERWRMLTAIDGRRNLHAIGRTLNLSDFDACRLLVDLIEAGVADIDEAAKAAAGNRDLVPTIPLPEGMAETVARPGDDHDAESVIVTRPSDEAKRATTKAVTVGTAEEGEGELSTPPSGILARRKARRRTPGGDGANAPTSPEPPATDRHEVSGPEAGGSDAPEGAADTEPRRPRRVVRIRSRAEPDPR